jgi:CBS domain-containing protein
VKTHTVEELMVPLSDYALVKESATLHEAVLALEAAQEHFDPGRYRHRAVLIKDSQDRVIGKLSQTDILRALEPKYETMLERERFAYTGLTRAVMKSMMAHYGLWGGALQDLCRKAAGQHVKDITRPVADGEVIDASATLDEAIHQLVVGGYQSLLVRREAAIVGVLRLTDVYAAVASAIKACAL